MSEPKYVAETLAWCNALRAERGKRPLKRLPKGIPLDPRSCPCGKATGLIVEYDGAYSDEGGRVAGTNHFVRRFIANFDDERLPQYEAKS